MFPSDHRAETTAILDAIQREIDILYDSQDSDIDPYFFERMPLVLVRVAVENVTAHLIQQKFQQNSEDQFSN